MNEYALIIKWDEVLVECTDDQEDVVVKFVTYDDSGTLSFRLSPKQARGIAKALIKRADEAEESQ